MRGGKKKIPRVYELDNLQRSLSLDHEPNGCYGYDKPYVTGNHPMPSRHLGAQIAD